MVAPVARRPAPATKDEVGRRRGKAKLSVRFDETVDGTSSTHVYEWDDSVPASDIWYVGDDYADMKYQSRVDAKEYRRRGFGSLLQGTFAFPHDVDVQERISAYVLHEGSQSRRGLERNLSRRHGEERSYHKDRARTSVLVHQRRLLRDGAKPDEVADKISGLYRENCRPASVFARRVALADELVARDGADSSRAERVLGIANSSSSNNNNNPGGAGGMNYPRMQRRLSNCSSVASQSSTGSSRAGYYQQRNARVQQQQRTFFGATAAPSSGAGAGATGAAAATRKRNPPKRCCGSPATPSEEFYAAIA